MKRLLTGLLLLVLVLSATACSSSDNKAAATDPAAEETAAWELLSDAYTYAFPLVLMDATKTAATNVAAPDLAGHAPVNQLIHVQKLADADTKMVVTPNVDTIYTQAWLDLAAEPLIFVMPAADRFFTVQVLDAWTNTPAVLKDAGVYAFTTPDWQGELPEDVTRVDVPTDMVWLIARIVLDGSEDLPAVREIQQGMQLLPLSAYVSDAAYTPPAGSYLEANNYVPVEKVLAMTPQEFFNTANQLMTANPPAEADAAVLDSFATLNIGAGLQFDATQLPGDIAAHWQDMLTNLRPTLVAAGQQYTVKMGNWSYFNEPIGDFGTAYAYRAMVALGGLGANTVDVAIYPKTNVDEAGNTLSGANSYVLHLDALPPTLAGGFWSITAYGSDDFLIANDLNRYCINDRSDYVLNEDGSLDIILAAQAPEDTANWLPIAADEFHLYLRIYYPDMQALQSWTAPVIKLS